MAGPIPRQSRRRPQPRRSAADVLAGLGAAALSAGPAGRRAGRAARAAGLADPALHARPVAAHSAAGHPGHTQDPLGDRLAGLAAAGRVPDRRGEGGGAEHRDAGPGAAGRWHAARRAQAGDRHLAAVRCRHRALARVHGTTRRRVRQGPGRPSHPPPPAGPGPRGADGPRPGPVRPRRPARGPARAPASRGTGRVRARATARGGHRSPPSPVAAEREDLRGPAAGRQVPRKPLGDRTESSRRWSALPGDLRAERRPGAAGWLQAHHRELDPPRLDPAHAT